MISNACPPREMIPEIVETKACHFPLQLLEWQIKGSFHLSELTGQPIPIVIRISLLIKTYHPDQSNPKYYVQRGWFFSKTSWKKPISSPKCLVQPASSDFQERPKTDQTLC